jgi:hypothetical protein
MSSDKGPDLTGGWKTDLHACAGYTLHEAPCSKDDACRCWNCQIDRHQRGRDT